jgi:hypothetical protein
VDEKGTESLTIVVRYGGHSGEVCAWSS